MRALAVLTLLLCPVSLPAVEVWKGVDAEGNVIYSDRPVPGGQLMNAPDVQTISPPPTPAQPAAAAQPAPGQDTGYSLIEILTPDQEATIRDNQGNVAVVVGLSPNLRSGRGERLQLLLDGAPASQPGTSTRFELQNVDRGTHQVQAVVVDARGRTLASSEPVTFFLHRVALGGTAR